MDGGAMSLSNLNDAQSMASTIATTTGRNNNNDDVVLMNSSNDNQLIDAINFGVSDSASAAIITSSPIGLSLMLSKQQLDNFKAEVVLQKNDTKFPFKQSNPINGKFPCGKAKRTVAPAFEIHSVKDIQCCQTLQRIQKNINEDLILENFPLKGEVQNKNKFHLKRKEIVIENEIKLIKEQVDVVKTLRFPVLLAQMKGFSEKSSISFSKANKSYLQPNYISYKIMQTTSCQLPITKSTSKPPATRMPSCEKFSQKFPIFKKQFFKFPISHQQNLKGTRGEGDDIENTKLMTSQNDDNERHFDEGIAAATLQQIQGQTLNLNAQKGNMPALNEGGDGAIDAMSILLLDIKHQQAENFHDAVEITKTSTTSTTVDAMKSSKNKQENEQITEQRNDMKLSPEIFERAENCKNQIMTKDILVTKDPTSKNLAHQEQSSSTTEHSFDICEVNTKNNNFRSKRESSKQPDNNNNNNSNNHHHQQIYSQQHQQPPFEQSEQSYTSPKSSDVRESSSEPEALHKNTLPQSVSSLLEAQPVSQSSSLSSSSVPSSPPLPSSTKSAVAPCTTPTSLAVSTPAHSDDDDESSAAPNIELLVYGNIGDVVVCGDISSRCVNYAANDDDISENEILFKDYESECAEILTDVIDLIEQTTAALLITGNLLTEARESKQKHGENEKETYHSWRREETPEVLLYEAEAEAMTVTKPSSEHSEAGEVCANREQKLLNDTSSVVNELDEMKFEMKRVKGALPNAGSSASLTSTTPHMSDNSTPSTTSRIRDVPTTERSSLSIKSPRVSDMGSTRRESLSRLHNTGITSTSTPTGSNLMPTASRISDITTSTRRLSITNSLVNTKGSPSQDSMEYVLPERTRLRRQRRMRSQETVEESPEDVIERLNKLKARISGALSEVKSVIKQYSTESEADASAAGIERPILSRSPSSISLSHQESVTRSPSGISLTQQDSVIKEEDHKEETEHSTAPVQFRFVRKVRRRSVFDEEEEYKAAEQETEKEATTVNAVDQTKNLDKSAKENSKENGFANESEEINLKHANIEEVTLKSAEPEQIVRKIALQEKSKDPVNSKIDFLHKVAEELNEKPATESIDLKHSIQKDAISNTTANAIQTEDKSRVPLINTILASVDKEAAKEPRKSPEPKQPIATHEEESCAEKPKKKIVLQKIKSTTYRRASIAAVEGSKIEPPVQSTLPLTIKSQRRPSDSEAVVKKKSVNKLTSDEPKVKTIVKVRRASVKREKSTTKVATNQEQENTQLKVKEGIKKATLPPVTIAKSKDEEDENNNNNSNANDVSASKSNNSNKDATTRLTSLVTEAQPKQLKIDGSDHCRNNVAASSTSSSPHDKTPLEDNINAAIAPKITSIASSASPLVATKANGHDIRISDKLVKLVGETIVIGTNGSDNKFTEDIKDKVTCKGKAESFASSESKELIHQSTGDLIIPALQNSSTNTIITQQAPSNVAQQVVKAANAAIDIDAVASKDDNAAVPQIAQQKALSVSATTPTTHSTTSTTTTKQIAVEKEATKDEAAAQNTNSVATRTTPDTSSASNKESKAASQKSSEDLKPTANTMPELKVASGPVQPVKLGVDGITSELEPFDVPSQTQTEDGFQTQKKKIFIKKLVRKNSIDRTANAVVAKEKAVADKLSNLLKDKHKISGMAASLNKAIPPKKILEKKSSVEAPTEKVTTAEEEPHLEITVGKEETAVESEQPEIVPKPTKSRKIKKKVIIKRQKRRLSISDTFFTQPEEEPKIPEIETIEKAISYVTDDESNENENDKALTETSKDEVDKPPLKPCLRCREYQVDDVVMYAERFKKTQVRWKRGRVIERITSISYKLEIEGKEVPAHISYIKKWTGRKVNFGGKEYLEIDYEQVAEEERRARSYSIWNMV